VILTKYNTIICPNGVTSHFAFSGCAQRICKAAANILKNSQQGKSSSLGGIITNSQLKKEALYYKTLRKNAWALFSGVICFTQCVMSGLLYVSIATTHAVTLRQAVTENGY
jgi:hypothetical protein